MAITTTLYYPSAYLPGPLKREFWFNSCISSETDSDGNWPGTTAACLYFDTNPNRSGFGFFLTPRPRPLRRGFGMSYQMGLRGSTYRY